LKHCIYILTLILFYSCNNNTSKENEPVLTNKPKPNQVPVDSVFTFHYQTDFSDKNIVNKSGNKVDLLFNGIDNYFGGQKSSIVGFGSECMGCLPVQEFNGGLLFGKRLLITSDSIKYYKNNFDIPDSTDQLKLFSDNGEKVNPKFNFQDGQGSINYIGISCNDANFYKVRLTFPSGAIMVDSLINASFFEYDLDANGRNEQYLMGLRNCSQELAILRIRK